MTDSKEVLAVKAVREELAREREQPMTPEPAPLQPIEDAPYYVPVQLWDSKPLAITSTIC